MNEFKQRLKKLDVLKEKADAVLLMNFDEPFKDVNYFYFTGNDSSYSAFLYDFSGARIITNELELPKIKHDSWIKNISIFERRKRISESIRKAIGKAKTVGVGGTFPYFLAKKLGRKIIDISGELENIRAIKSGAEIENIKKACMATAGIMDELKVFIKPGVSEKQAAEFLKIKTIKRGCNLPFMGPIVNSGRKTSIPHETMPDRVLGKNSIVMVDYSALCKNYYSDCTRMFFTGRIDKKVKQNYELLRNIMDECLDSINIGMKAGDVDRLVRKRLGPLSKNFIHATGHGVGLALHEKPFIGGKTKDILKENMVFTIEPGIYFKNYGLRIEDTVLLTGKGIKILTKI